jgi:hypothetical protein
MCVLPKENIASILNRLMVDGLVEYQEFPSTSESQACTMFGVNQTKVVERLGLNLAQAILNILIKFGKIGRHANLI